MEGRAAAVCRALTYHEKRYSFSFWREQPQRGLVFVPRAPRLVVVAAKRLGGVISLGGRQSHQCLRLDRSKVDSDRCGAAYPLAPTCLSRWQTARLRIPSFVAGDVAIRLRCCDCGKLAASGSGRDAAALGRGAPTNARRSYVR